MGVVCRAYIIHSMKFLYNHLSTIFSFLYSRIFGVMGAFIIVSGATLFFAPSYALAFTPIYDYQVPADSLNGTAGLVVGSGEVSTFTYLATTTDSMSEVQYPLWLGGIDNVTEYGTAGTVRMNVYSSLDGTTVGTLLSSSDWVNVTTMFPSPQPCNGNTCTTTDDSVHYYPVSSAYKTFSFSTPLTFSVGYYYIFRLETSGFDCADVNYPAYACTIFSRGGVYDNQHTATTTGAFDYSHQTKHSYVRILGGSAVVDSTTRIISTDPANYGVVNPAFEPFDPLATSTVSIDVDIYFNDVTDGSIIDQVCVELQNQENYLNPQTFLPICQPIISSGASTLTFNFTNLLHGRYYAIAYFDNTVDYLHWYSHGWEFISQYTNITNQTCAFGQEINGLCQPEGFSGYASTTPIATTTLRGMVLDDCSLMTDLPTKALCAVANTIRKTVNWLIIPDSFVFNEYVGNHFSYFTIDISLFFNELINIRDKDTNDYHLVFSELVIEYLEENRDFIFKPTNKLNNLN